MTQNLARPSSWNEHKQATGTLSGVVTTILKTNQVDPLMLLR